MKQYYEYTTNIQNYLEKTKGFFMKKIGMVIVTALALITSCRTIQYVPIETNTDVHVKDSTIYNYIDSIRIHEATRYKDLAWLGDTLQIEGKRSRMWAVADTTKEVLLGGLEEDKVEEHSKIIYKDRIVVKDSIRTVEKPVPVEITKEVEVIPRFWRFTGIFGIICLVILSTLAGWKIYGFFKGKDILKVFRK